MITIPYVTAAVIIFVETTTTLMVFGVSPVWMMITTKASSWQQGVALVPIGVDYIIGTFLSSTLMKKAGSWLLTFVGSIGLGVFTTIIPLCSDIPELVAPYLTLGIASGTARDTAAFAISVTAMDVGTVLGLGIGGVFLNAVGFFRIMLGAGIFNILLSPVAILLRNPPSIEKKDEMTIVYKEENQLKTLSYRPQPGEDP
ncbi:chromaffin granule amine transporter-like isoform X3 [Branchiostoma lanceolatum]|uniref:chromaffin granule amine transporter-like isoform X3 n=1 Tax=Branchiostoma lanceolatum TaxID=7740 RepID=UPI003453A104